MESNAGWSDFLVASAGATAALAGLVFVALSINLGKILALAGVTERAGETILLLASGLVGSLAALIPHETPSQLGLWLLVLWLPTWLVPTLVQLRDFAKRRYYRAYQAVIRFLLFQGATVPLLLAGLSLTGAFGRWSTLVRFRLDHVLDGRFVQRMGAAGRDCAVMLAPFDSCPFPGAALL